MSKILIGKRAKATLDEGRSVEFTIADVAYEPGRGSEQGHWFLLAVVEGEPVRALEGDTFVTRHPSALVRYAMSRCTVYMTEHDYDSVPLAVENHFMCVLGWKRDQWLSREQLLAEPANFDITKAPYSEYVDGALELLVRRNAVKQDGDKYMIPDWRNQEAL